MSTSERGATAEAAVLTALLRHGVQVSVPWGAAAYDLVADLGGPLVRVQVKAGRLRDGVVRFNACSTDHGRGRTCYAGRADVLAVHCADLDAVYVVGVADAGRYGGHIRVTPTRNGQSAGVRHAASCTVERWVTEARLA